MTETQYVNAVQRLMRRLCVWSRTLGHDEQAVFSNALLNTAALRMREELGAIETAKLLWRLADVISQERAVPTADRPEDLQVYHA